MPRHRPGCAHRPQAAPLHGRRRGVRLRQHGRRDRRRRPGPPTSIVNPRIGLIAGSGGGSCANQVEAADLLRAKGVRRVGPYMVTRTMCSTVSANLATAFRIRGLNYSISSACATSAHCIGAAMEQIQLGKQDIVFAGGGEELHWTPDHAVRRDGRAVLEVQRDARTRFARLRRRPRRLRDRRRRRHGGGRVARARAGARREASWPRSSATAPPPTAPTWSRPRAKAPRAACARRWPPSTARSITSTPTAPRRRSATSPNWARCAKCSATRSRRSRRPSRCPAIRSARPACTRRSTAC